MEWRKINGYNYLLSSNGDLISIKRQCRLSRIKKKNGYYVVNMSCNNIKKQFLIHRLVASTFLSNPENKPCVNHKDGNKANNIVSNLEWVTYSENEKHSYDFLGKKPPKHLVGRMHKSAKLVLNTNTGIFYETITEASKSINSNRLKLSAMLNENERWKNTTDFIKV